MHSQAPPHRGTSCSYCAFTSLLHCRSGLWGTRAADKRVSKLAIGHVYSAVAEPLAARARCAQYRRLHGRSTVHVLACQAGRHVGGTSDLACRGVLQRARVPRSTPRRIHARTEQAGALRAHRRPSSAARNPDALRTSDPRSPCKLARQPPTQESAPETSRQARSALTPPCQLVVP